jgi:catechol 2,3-dioxygenase-like lactoylglutathione lyase family enzyme
LRLPGHGPEGPTLEIFSYDAFIEGNAPPPNRTGYGHIGFQVPDVHATVAVVLSSGGSAVGEIVDATIPGAGPLRWAYVRDPEGNIIELQRWSPDGPG